MEVWKLKQEIFHRLNTDYDDDLKTKNVEISSDISGNAIRCFLDDTIGFIYPAKSYMVAICYAKWLEQDYGGDRYDYLNDPDLLYGNDPYFNVYNDDKIVYNTILDTVTWDFDETIGLVPDVRKYYDAECGL